MPITSIKRDQAKDPNIVRVTTTEDFTAITTAGYLIDQASVIKELNNGPFEWVVGDVVWIDYSGGNGPFTHDADNDTFAFNDNLMPNDLPSAQIWVGNAQGVATARPVTGAFSLNNVGFTALNAGVVTYGVLNEGVRPLAIVKYMGQATTVGGGATETFAVEGALDTDRLFTNMVSRGSNNVNILHSTAATDEISVTFSADPGNDCEFNWQLLRLSTP